MAFQPKRVVPSGADRWANCPGSLRMEYEFPKPEMTEAADEGIRAHKIVENLLLGEELQGNIDPEMLAHANNFLDFCHSHSHENSGTETAFDLGFMAGRVDYWSFDTETGTLHIWDYKYGRSPVEAIGNLQLLSYAVGLLPTLVGEGKERISFVFHLYQPRAFHPDGIHRVWKLTPAEFLQWSQFLYERAAEALGDAPRTVSGNHCKYCRARHGCPTARKAAGQAIAIVEYNATPELLDESGLGYELEFLQAAKSAIEYRLTGIEEQIKAKLRAGGNVPGWKLTEGRGKKVWAKPDSEIIALGKLLGVELAKPPEPITPRQAINLGLSAKLVNSYSVHNAGGQTLTKDNGAERAKEIFG